jgi:hypothetical protein
MRVTVTTQLFHSEDSRFLSHCAAGTAMQRATRLGVVQEMDEWSRVEEGGVATSEATVCSERVANQVMETVHLAESKGSGNKMPSECLITAQEQREDMATENGDSSDLIERTDPPPKLPESGSVDEGASHNSEAEFLEAAEKKTCPVTPVKTDHKGVESRMGNEADENHHDSTTSGYDESPRSADGAVVAVPVSPSGSVTSSTPEDGTHATRGITLESDDYTKELIEQDRKTSEGLGVKGMLDLLMKHNLSEDVIDAMKEIVKKADSKRYVNHFDKLGTWAKWGPAEQTPDQHELEKPQDGHDDNSNRYHNVQSTDDQGQHGFITHKGIVYSYEGLKWDKETVAYRSKISRVEEPGSSSQEPCVMKKERVPFADCRPDAISPHTTTNARSRLSGTCTAAVDSAGK